MKKEKVYSIELTNKTFLIGSFGLCELLLQIFQHLDLPLKVLAGEESPHPMPNTCSQVSAQPRGIFEELNRSVRFHSNKASKSHIAAIGKLYNI